MALFGLFGVGNFGNTASLRTALEAATRLRPDRPIVVVCAVPEVVTSTFDVDAVRITMSRWEGGYSTLPRPVRLLLRPLIEVDRMVELVRFLRRVDAVIVPGTGILDDFGVRPQQMPWDLFRWTLVAKLMRKPFAFVSVGAGPIEHPVSRWLMRRAAIQASSRSFRDEVSRAYMASLGAASADDPVLPDVVFGLSHPEPTPVRRAGSLRIGVGVMAFYGWPNDRRSGAGTFDHYVERLASLVEGLLDDGHSVRLLTGEHDDVVAVERLIGELTARRGAECLSSRVGFEPVRSLQGLFEQIQLTDAIVATRYHNVVAALMMGRPTVSVGYAEKNCEVMRAVGLESCCYRVEDFEPQAVRRRLAAIAEKWDEHLPRVTEQMKRWREQVDEHYALIFGGALAENPRACEP